MKSLKLFTLVGGISSDSLNRKFYRSLEKLDIPHFEFTTFDLSKLPFFTKDLENDPPDIVVGFKDEVRLADAILFITPEYNRSVPGVLKNAIDWCSRPYGENLWNEKFGAIMGASIGNIGTFGAQHHLRQILSYLNMYVLNSPEFYFNASDAFDKNENLVNEKTKELVTSFFDSYYKFIETIHGPFTEFQSSSSYHEQQLQQ